MIQFLRTAAAFVRKDFLDKSSYRVQFLLGLGIIVAQMVFLAVLSEFLGPLVGERTGFSGRYFDFVVLGLCMLRFLTTALYELSRSIRTAQTLGTLEALLATRTGIPTLVICLPLFAFLQATLAAVGYLCLGWVFFGMPFHPGSFLTTLVVFAAAVAAFGCLGMISAALTIAFKRTDAFNGLISTASIFIGGVWFPRDAWPGWVQTLAQGLPITPALEGVRTTLLDGGGLAAVAPELLHLMVFVALTLPLGVITFRWALRRAMRDGTLTQY